MHQLTFSIISRYGNVARLHLESAASLAVVVTLGKNTSVPVQRSEGQYSDQQADWQMSDGYGSDHATIRCGQQIALLAWSCGQIIQRSGSLPIAIVDTSPVGSHHAPKMHTHALRRATA
jgi:hypothetical protein